MKFLGIHCLDSFTINPQEKSTLGNKEDVIAVHFRIASLPQCKDFTLGVVYKQIARKFHIKGQFSFKLQVRNILYMITIIWNNSTSPHFNFLESFSYLPPYISKFRYQLSWIKKLYI
jgi:hypothetical protein